MGQSVLAADKKPLTKEESAKVIEAAIRQAAKKPTGELTKADYEKVKLIRFNNAFDIILQLTNVKGLEKLTQLTRLYLNVNQLTDVKGLEKLTNLKVLYLRYNPDLTKAQIDELKKALPKCRISSNPKK
jgi:Leucine-rich repeat (LRR) protein